MESFANAENKFFQLTELLSNNHTKQMWLSEVESIVNNEGRELLRRLLQGHADERGLGDMGDFIKGSDGIVRTHKLLSERQIKTLCGTIKIKRIGYSSRGKNSLFPKDSLLNLPKIAHSFGVQKLVSQEAIRGSFEESLESIERMTGLKISKRQAEKIILATSSYFYDFYSQNEYKLGDTQNLPLLVLTLDGKGIAMRKESLRAETRLRSEENPHKLKQRLSPGEKKNSKRMAVVASVYEVERFIRSPEEIVTELFEQPDKSKKKRPKPVNKRVWASLKHSFQLVVSEMFEEANKRDPNRKKEWIALVDGDKKQRRYLKHEAKKHGVKLTIICDFIHVLEYLWDAGHVFFNKPEETEQWVKERLLRILSGKSSLTAAGMRRSATNKKFAQTKRKNIDKCAKYLLNLSSYLNYLDYLNHGYPIATGVIEGACRHLIKDRMGITGARWGLNGAEAILKLRSLKVSGEFDDYWEFYEQQEFIRNHWNQYADPIFLNGKI